jgi:hypothetical protein
MHKSIKYNNPYDFRYVEKDIPKDVLKLKNSREQMGNRILTF